MNLAMLQIFAMQDHDLEENNSLLILWLFHWQGFFLFLSLFFLIRKFMSYQDFERPILLYI